MGGKLRLTDKDLNAITRAHKFLSHEEPLKITIEMMAGIIGINRSKLSYGFKNIYGVSMYEFEQIKRMEKAKLLLSTTQEPVETIAMRVGYRRSNQLTKFFKRKYGITPLQYQKGVASKRTKMVIQKSKKARKILTPSYIARAGGW